MGIFNSLMKGLGFSDNSKKKNNSPAVEDKNKPIFIIAGKDDPVGNMGRSVKNLFELYMQLGIEEVKMKLYEGCRHEILNEPIKEKVYEDILSFIKK